MTKLAKYLKSSAGLVALIVGLLFLQAYCDLELPDYTSRDRKRRNPAKRY